ncbi:cucumber peeling cupredoxin-like [Vigna umbellata]|uniref:cucumber peeling cupredoxin-like n=1 Tax=Vigna umbellata TaxID=87088 RepID=UPI001F5EA9CF|nr:cucumber peeling cupredoxin-like [Vigna umbellata]
MAQLLNMVILVAIAVSATILTGTEAAEYTVGNSTCWISAPTGGASFYSDWASTITFREGDILEFRFSSGHTVAELNDKASFDSCSVDQNMEVLTSSPAKITLIRTGEFYFACTITGHCSSGQKLSVNVTASSSSPSSPPASGTTPTPPSGEVAPTPQSPPAEPGSTPPPSPGSATSLVATFSLVFTTLVVNSLFF